MENTSKEEIRREVRQRYAGVAKGCCSSADLRKEPSCCGNLQESLENMTVDLGYSKEEISSVPTVANMGLGCGNPTAMAFEAG
jgi:hypothetical protein